MAEQELENSKEATTPEPAQHVPEEDSETSKGRNHKITRSGIAFSVFLQLVLAFVLLVIINIVNYRHYARVDLSREGNYGLSPKSRRIVDNLDAEAKIIAFVRVDSPVYRDLIALLKEYEYVDRDNIEIEAVDPSLAGARQRDLVAQYSISAREDAVIVSMTSEDGEEQFRAIPTEELIEVEPGEETPVQRPRADRISKFWGESRITNALIELSQGERKKLYFSQGYGEPSVDVRDGELSEIISALGRDYVEVEGLSLPEISEIPEDADGVCIVSPNLELHEDELVKLWEYWNRGGRLFFAMSPQEETTFWRGFLAENGVRVTQYRILTKTGPMAAQKDILVDLGSENPVTGRLGGLRCFFPGGTTAIGADEGTLRRRGNVMQFLAYASDLYWAEKNYQPEGGNEFDEGKDDRGPLAVAISVESIRARGEEGSGRMVVISNAEFLRDGVVEKQGANMDLFLASINWLLDREDLIEIGPREKTDHQVRLDSMQASSIWWLTIVGVPGCAAFLGIVIWLRRRK